jgi:hypothetical protein
MDAERPNDRNRLIEFIAATVEAMRDQIDTMDHKIGTIEDKMATKDAMEAGFTAVRGDIERVALQLDQVDRKQSLRTAALESEVSRIRSVVYLVVKDQPDLVRLLGG